jgi:hypothetical protein
MKSMNVREWIGAACTILGSFLPWQCGSDFVPSCLYGIQVRVPILKYWITGLHKFTLEDHGGVSVILLTAAFILISVRPLVLIKKPILWKLIISILIMALPPSLIIRWLPYWPGAPFVVVSSLSIGFVCVVIGASLILWTSIATYRQAGTEESKTAG